jgi:hypothetical protein
LTGHHFLLRQRDKFLFCAWERASLRVNWLVDALRRQGKAHKLVAISAQGSGGKKPWTPACGLVRLFDVKKKPLSRINGERKKRMSGAGPSGKWERGEVSTDRVCIVCLSPFKPMMISRLFKDWLLWNCVQIVKIIPANLPKVKACSGGLRAGQADV